MNGVVFKDETAEERLAFLSQFGWEVDEEPAEVKEVIIPQEFDDVYNQYNIIQKEQNLDLEKYKGARVKCWSYNVKNYPGYENSTGVIKANMLIFDGVVKLQASIDIKKDGYEKWGILLLLAVLSFVVSIFRGIRRRQRSEKALNRQLSSPYIHQAN